MANPIPTATGRREQRGELTYVVLERSFRAPIDVVWVAVTEPARLARWIGTWSGDPDEGSVQFRMTFEVGGSVETMEIVECAPPRRLRIHSEVAGEPRAFVLALDLAEAAGGTTLTFAQALSGPDEAESMGPGWDYYLDRLVVAEEGGDIAGVLWDDYYPGLSAHYRALFR